MEQPDKVWLLWLVPPGESFSVNGCILHSLWYDEEKCYQQYEEIRSDPVLWVYELKVEGRKIADAIG